MATLDDYREVLERFVGADVPWETPVRYSPLIAALGYPRSFALVGPGSQLGELGHFIPGEGIVVRRRNLNTAAGMALLVHEAQHAVDAEQFPGGPERFVEEYKRLEALRQRQGLPVWMHPMEFPNYVRECSAWHTLVAEGWPPGDWLPLGVSEDLCGATSV